MSKWEDEEKDLQGGVWSQPSPLVHGTYGGAGDVGEANLRYLRKEHEDRILHWPPPERLWGRNEQEMLDEANLQGKTIIIRYGAYDSRWAYIKATPENIENILEPLEDYPVLDDDTLFEVQMEWIGEALDNWFIDDLTRIWDDYLNDSALEDDERVQKLKDLWEDENRWEKEGHEQMVREAVNSLERDGNLHWEFEYSGAWTDIDRIKSDFLSTMEGLMVEQFLMDKDTLPLFPEKQ